jgi:hypothetical protein
MALTRQAPTALRCYRCGGPMFREASDALDYVCLLCGEYHFLVPRRVPLSEALVADLATKQRRSHRHTSRYRRPVRVA